MSTVKMEAWPELPYDQWSDTLATLHRWTQIIGKIRLARMPMMDGWWQVPLYVTARGLTTSPIPAGDRTFQLDFDFCAHEFRLEVSNGYASSMLLYPRSVANFYEAVMSLLDAAGLSTTIWPVPVELLEPNPKAFDKDEEHGSYDRDAVQRWWRILTQIDQVMKEFSARFVGRISPVQFFWGTFDLSVARYSGRKIAPKPHTNIIERYAFAMEQEECGFWPGNDKLKAPAFFAFAAPPPAGYAQRPVQPAAASFNHELGEFILLYDAVRRAGDPKQALLDFFSSTYDVGARPPTWDRAQLDWQPPALH